MTFLNNSLTGRNDLSAKEVLSSKKGLAQAMGITLIALFLLSAAGVVVANFAILSRQTSQLTSLTQEISNRAEQYAGSLNANLVSPEVPVMARECSTIPAMCTVILSATPSADGKQTVLRIQGDTVSLLGQTITKDVTLVSSDVTHVTAIDENGSKVWAASDEGLQYQVWGVAAGEPRTVKPEDIAGPGIGANWVSVSDRAGIDSSGALWVWGPNNMGQAGIGAAGAAQVAPTKIAGASSFRSVVTTDDRGYAIDSTGTPWVWGKNDKGQLSLGHSNPVMVPTKADGSRIMSFAPGKDNIFAITMAGDLVVAGASQAGFPVNTPNQTQILNPGTKYKAVAASTAGAVAMIDSTGKLTMANSGYTFTPSAVKFTSVSLGSTAGYAISTDGKLYSWGLGTNGQLGLGASTSVVTPTLVMGGTSFAAVSGGKTSAFAIDVSGNLYYFGKTPSGWTGGVDLPQVSVPTKLLTESRFRGIAANNNDTRVALLDTEGSVYGLGTATAGLWPINYLGPNDQPIRMPMPDGFPTYTWE